MPTLNGSGQRKNYGGLPDPFVLNAMREIVDNSTMMRSRFLDNYLDGRRDIDGECNYPTGGPVQIDFYRALYAREAVAKRVVQVWPKECWQVQPHVYEDDDPENSTPFEEAFDEVGKGLIGTDSYFDPSGGHDSGGNPLWSYLCRADILSGIGTFGIVLLGLDDGMLMEQPAKGAPPDGNSKSIYGGLGGQQKLSSTLGTDAQYFGNPFLPLTPKSVNGKSSKSSQRKLIYLGVFDEPLVQVVQYEADWSHPRFGQPLMYLVTLNDPNQPHTGVGLPLATLRVHWSRVIHLADNLRSSKVFGVPRMEPVLNRLIDLRKLYGGSAEGYWKGALPLISLETNPQLGGDVVIDKPGINDMMYNVMNSLQRYMTLTGLQAKTLSGQVSDPTPHIAAQIEAICIELSIPVRVFKGSERGELASSQDDSQWNDRLRHRQASYLTPNVIVPFVDRLIQLGVLPKPKQYYIEWPDLDSQTDAQKAQILLQKSQAYAAYVGGNVESILPPIDYMTKFDNLDPDEAQAILDDAEQKQQEEQQQAQMLAEQHGFQPEPPEGFTHPPAPPQQQPPIKVKPGEKLVQPPQQPQPGGKPKPLQPSLNADYDVLGHKLVTHGGPGSGDAGHAGRPGEIGGSGPGGGGHGAAHGEHAHLPVGSMGMEVLHESNHLSQIIHALPKAVAQFVAGKSGQAATSEGIEHGIEALHEHAQAAAAHEAVHGAEGAAGGEHGAHGGAEHAIGAFLEATGAILGSKVSGKLEKSLGIEKKANELYAKMKEEHGALAPWLHAAATATTMTIKGTIAHALGGPLGAVAGSAMGHLGEHILGKATEGLFHGAAEFGAGAVGFAIPGISYAALLATHALGKMLNKTGITDTKLAHKAGDLQRKIQDTKGMKAVHGLLHGAEEHMKNITSLRLIKEAKLAGAHGAGAGRGAWAASKAAAKSTASGAKSIWQQMQLPPSPSSAPGHFGGGRIPLATANAQTVTGKLPGGLDPNNPAVEWVIQLLRHTIQSLMKTPLWDKLNTPEGRQLVKGLIA